MGTHARFVKFIRHWEPRCPSISKQSVMRSVEEQSRALRADIKCEMLERAAGMDIPFYPDAFYPPERGKNGVKTVDRCHQGESGVKTG